MPQKLMIPVISIVVAFGLVVAGIILGYAPINSCGSLFSPASFSIFDSVSTVFCESYLRERAGGVWFLFIVGAFIFIFAVLSLPDVFTRTHRKDNANASRPQKSASVTEQLAKLTEMHSAGVLTDDEFAAAKGKVLGE